jgi:AcrR family transcriptional regulator
MQISARPGSSTEETRARIIAAAKEIYEQNGTRGTTTRLVAERAGVNEATLFRHFGSKQALLLAMREGACPLAVFECVLASLSGDLREDLRTIARLLVERMHAQRAMMCISLAEDARDDVSGSGPEWRGPIELLQRFDAYFASLIEQGRVHGDSARLAAFFMGMCFSYVLARKIWNSHVPKSDDLDLMVDIFLNGVK